MMPSEFTPETEYAALVNSLIPFMSPEDGVYTAKNLARLFPDAFGGYEVSSTQTPPPPELTSQIREQYESGVRARNVLDTLEKVREVSGKAEKDFGPGFSFLKQTAGILQQFGGAPRQSRQQFVQQQAALDPLLAETKGQNLAAFGSAARMLTQPFFSAGPLRGVARIDGGYDFGAPNKKLFG
jgi:hypothetical protein